MIRGRCIAVGRGYFAAGHSWLIGGGSRRYSAVNGDQGQWRTEADHVARHADKLMGAVVPAAIQTAAEPRIVGLPRQTSGSEVIRSNRDIS